MSDKNQSNNNGATEKDKSKNNKEEKSNLRRQPSKLDNERIRQILQDEEKLQKHLQPLFYAMLRGSPQQEDEQQEQQVKRTTREKPKLVQPQRQFTKKKVSPTDGPPVQQPRVPIDDYIPQDPQAIRETPVFGQLYSLIQFQRDQYLVGTEYATWQQKERQSIVQADPNDRLPYDTTALGHAQLARIAADFIPTATVRDATLPLITPLPTETLYPLLQQATNSSILGEQDNLNSIAIGSVLAFLKNPQNRLAIKKSTYGFIDTKYNEVGDGVE